MEVSKTVLRAYSVAATPKKTPAACLSEEIRRIQVPGTSLLIKAVN
jgi:hypothetical protein